MPWSTRKATWWTRSIWVTLLPERKTPSTPQKRQVRAALPSVQARTGSLGGAAGPGRKVGAVGGSCTSQRVAGMIQAATAAPRRRKVHRIPTRSIRNWEAGRRSAMPTPIPAEAMPRAVPTRDGNHPLTRTTDGRNPLAAMPTATAPPKLR